MSSKFAETNRTAGPPLVPTQIDERASKKLEGRISLWASKAAANERNSSITERRFSLHINRRSHQSLHGPTPSQDAIDEERAEPYPGDEEQLLKEEEPTGDDEQVVFTSEFHEEMYILVHSHAWVLFILCVVLVNTAALILLAAINIKARAGWYMELLESVFIGIFLTESVIELYVYRFRYFFSVWHVMDFLIVVLNIVDLVLAICNINVEAYGATTVFRLLRIMRSLRALRVLRVLQPFKFFSTLRVILVTIERSAIPMGIIAVMMFYIICILRTEILLQCRGCSASRLCQRKGQRKRPTN